MMRGPGNWAVAVRKPSGEIAHVSHSIDSAMARHRVYRLPIVRGVIALGESLAIGFRALSVSAHYAAAEEAEGDEEPAEIGRWALFFSFLLAIGFAVSVFKVGPGLLADLLPISSGPLFPSNFFTNPASAVSPPSRTRLTMAATFFSKARSAFWSVAKTVASARLLFASMIRMSRARSC